MTNAENQIVVYQPNETMRLDVRLENETVWLTQAQLCALFGVVKSNVSYHIKKIFGTNELDYGATVQKIRTVQLEAGRSVSRDIEYFNLDVIISVGYRVKSQRGVEFRRWATSVLREYLIKGYAVNKNRLRQLDQTVEIMKRVSNSLDTEQVLDVVKTYSSALDLLDGYDHQTIEKPKVKGRSVELTYEDCRKFIDGMRFAADSPLFGNEKDGSFKSALGAV